MRMSNLFGSFNFFFYLYCLFVGVDFFFVVFGFLGVNVVLFGLCNDEDIYYYFGEV